MRRILTALILILGYAVTAGANSYYTHGSFPTTGSAATSAAMRAELDLISAGFDKLPDMTGNASKPVIVNGSATGLTVTTGTLSLAGNFTITGAYATTLTATAATSLTLPTTGTLATVAGAESFINKTIVSPAFSGTATGSLAGLSLTSPTITTPTGIVKGDVGLGNVDNTSDATKNTASATLTNKSISGAANTITNVSLTAGVTGILPPANGGTGSSWVPTAGQVLIGNGTTYVAGTLTAGTGISITNGSGSITVAATLPRAYLAGLTLSTAGSSNTMTVAAGQATDSTNAQTITLATSLGKNASPWGVGASGCLDTGGIANSTWYHFFAILRTDTGVVDVLCSLSATSPSMPASYGFKRRIGAGKTDGSANWTAFVQSGDLFQWAVPVNDATAGDPGTSAVTLGVTVPTGVNVIWVGSAGLVNVNSTETALLVTDLATTDTAPTTALHHVVVGNIAGNQRASTYLQVRANTSGQIRHRINASSSSTTVLINTTGWLDRRGRDD